MPVFTYKAKANPYEAIQGAVKAENKLDAIHKVAGMGFFVLSVEEAVKTAPRRKVALKDVANFTRQLSDLLSSGITIVASLDILSGQTQNNALKSAIADIRDQCIEGNTFSRALEGYPEIFSNLYTSLIRSGEASGTLDEVLERLAEFADKQLETHTKVRSALAYPVLMAVVGVITIMVLLTFVIPKITGMFADLGQALPGPTLILIKISDAVKNYWWAMLLGMFSAAVVFKQIYGTNKGRFDVDSMKLRIPVFGGLIKKIEVARFARTLATLLKNGVPVLEALNIVKETVGNALLKDEIAGAYLKVREGASLAEGFHKKKVMPQLVVNMIAVGEEGGKVDETLFKVADSFDRESDAAIKTMMSLLEPIMILVLGGIVGFIVISMLLPIFEINFLAK